MLKIITRPLYPILPTNAFDWCAYAVTRTTVHVHYGLTATKLCGSSFSLWNRNESVG